MHVIYLNRTVFQLCPSQDNSGDSYPSMGIFISMVMHWDQSVWSVTHMYFTGGWPSCYCVGSAMDHHVPPPPTERLSPWVGYSLLGFFP